MVLEGTGMDFLWEHVRTGDIQRGDHGASLGEPSTKAPVLLDKGPLST